ncbi:MAG: FtsX-like permease family protein [Gemmatimonadaceae bacterium]|nr:FtsX-like permease family protein [Gemmatimonadaceae bacterium]NUR18921.1 FtsX-like permease family protein [Gemmatimonadaceae bacterium]NUS98504.1 FtsX-like permease family protein [Gemmatimonadaceae bacterium]
MLIGETVAVALSALRVNKLRSVLTMLGVVIGVAAVVAMVALGRGAQESVNKRIAALGTTLLTVIPGQVFGRGVASGTDRAKLTLDDAIALEERATIIAAVEPEMTQNQQIQYVNKNANTQVIGTSSNYPDVRKYTIAVGRMFSDAEDRARARVAVLGAAIPDNLGVADPASLVGEDVRIGGLLYNVVGVLASKGQTGGFQNPDDQILIPINTARFRAFGTDRLRSINVLAPTEAKIPETMAEIQKILRREHQLRPGASDDFQIRNQSDFLSTLGETTQVFTYLLAGIAAVSLLVGGIGIMNIMLVSVTERTREIGVRKALGATRANILLQFLIEAVVLCILGGIGGVLLGAGGAMVMSRLAQWTTSVSVASVVIALIFSAGVGILFGVWPARRAAALDPIMALRYE